MVGQAPHRVMANNHQFVLIGGDGSQLIEARLPISDSLVSDESGQLAVRTGAYAAPVELLIEQHAAEPEPASSDWEDVVEFSGHSSHSIVAAELFGDAIATVVSRPGWCRVRLSARGRDFGERRGEVGPRAKIIEHYLIQTWPAPPGDGVSIRASSLQPVDHTAGRVHLAAGRAAVDRINRDLDRMPGHRTLNGATAAVEAQWTYTASPRKLFRYMALPNLWTSAMGSGSTKPELGARYWLSHNDYRDIWDGIPTSSRGHLEGTIVQIAAPRLAVSTWQWLDSRDYGEGQPILSRPTTITMQLSPAAGGDPSTTTVSVRHEDLPVEWVGDMTAVWLCKLEAGRAVYRIHR